MEAVVLVAALVFVAEMGDKSQLLALSFGARLPVRVVLTGLGLATAVMQAISVTVGAAVAAVVPERAVATGAGLLFLGFALWTLRQTDDLDHDPMSALEAPPPSRRGVATVAGSFLAAELGDKTMLASATLAAVHGPLLTWVGATAGMLGASTLAVLVGSQAASRIEPRAIRLLAGGGFALVGAALLVDAAR
jgi:Ca2+/H+ antiporter, TMEM165/GDT1 family